MARRAGNMLARLHTNCRKANPVPYIRDDDQMRCGVPDEKVPWHVPWSSYDPEDYTMKHVLSQPVWADPVRLERLRHPVLCWSILS